MRKLFFFLIFACVILVALKAAAYWPFEKEWENNPTERNITLNDNGYKFVVVTQTSRVDDFLAEQKVTLGTEDHLFPPRESELVNGSEVQIKRALPVTIKVDGEEKSINTFARIVEDAISDAEVTVSRLDKVEPGKNTPLEKNMQIVITRINVEEVTEEETIEFQTIEKDDPKLKWRKMRVDQEGENGTKAVQYRITYTNGKQTSKVKLSQEITKKPVSKLVAIGTKIEVGKTTRGRASWYAYTGTMACASLQFPKGTWLRVSNTATGKQVIVQVNDSGPYAPDKIIDLDKVAFEKLAPLGAGVFNAKVEEILE